MRTTVQTQKERCQGCGACAIVCPAGAISFSLDAEGFSYPAVDSEKCVGCDLCETRCPSGKQTVCASEPFGAQTRDREARLQASSGGIFMLLADQVLSQGGVVFGTVLNENLQAETIGAITRDEAMAMRGSKYVQGNCREAYGYVLDLCQKGLPVLFSGTPCQVAGLLALFQERPKMLVTVDFICHGTPSPGVFASYLSELERKEGSPIVSYRFRDKRLGWKNFSVVAEFENGHTYTGTQTTDSYMRGFLGNLYLRPSCHVCTLRGHNSPADLTLGDLWGAQEICPDRDDDSGLSLIQCHTERGRQLFMDCGAEFFALSDTAKLTRYNPSLEKPVPPHPKRKAFFRQFAHKGFEADKVVRLLTPPGRAERALNRLLHAPAALRRRLLPEKGPHNG